MDNIEKVYLETRLRNLERHYAKVVQHPDLLDLSGELKSEIEDIKNQLR
jgi:hypothetical protein